MYAPFEIRTPRVVTKRHRGFRFSNGAKVVIIEDPECTTSVGAATVFVGSNHDPKAFPGLAHFCEHMLFMGTAAFPKEDAFDAFVSQHSGYTNAWTMDTTTTYYFTVANEQFAEGVDRFLQFFATPLFSPSAVRREVEAVHSEDEKNHAHDYWRLDEIMRSLADKRHPFASYGNGNRSTLLPSLPKKVKSDDEPNADDTAVEVDEQSQLLALRSALVAFFESYYTADAMSFVFYTNLMAEDLLPVLSRQITQLRSSPTSQNGLQNFIGRRVIRSNSFVPDENHDRCAPFAASAMRRVYVVQTKKKIRSIRFVFPFRSPLAERFQDASGYASHVIGHECDVSLLGQLKHHGLATALTAGESHAKDDDDTTFYVDISLTIEGFQQLERVSACLFAAVGMLNRLSEENGGKADEGTMSQMTEEEVLAFEMTELSRGTDHCANLSSSLHDAERSVGRLEEAMFIVPRRCSKRCADFIATHLTPDNCVMLVLWDGFPTDATLGSTDANAPNNAGLALFNQLPEWTRLPCTQCSAVHRAYFSSNAIPEPVLSKWRDLAKGGDPLDDPVVHGLGLPPRNPFLATDFEVFPSVSHSIKDTTPFVSHTGYGTLVVRPSLADFPMPKVALEGRWHSPVAYKSPLSRFFTRVMHSVCKHACTALMYSGTLASITNDLVLTPSGIGWSLEGPSHRLVAFFGALIEKTVDEVALKGTEALFQTYVDVERRKLESIRLSQAHDTARDRLQWMLTQEAYNETEILNAVIESSSGSANGLYEQYRLFVAEYLSGLYYTTAVVGNVPSGEAVQRDLALPLEGLLKARGIPILTDETVVDRLLRKIPHMTSIELHRNEGDDPAPILAHLQTSAHPADDLNSSVVLDIQLGEESVPLRLAAEALIRLMQSKFFNALRTVEALGYCVLLSSTQSRGVVGIRFAVQSAVPKASAAYLLSRVVAFLYAVEASWGSAICTLKRVMSTLESQLTSRKESLKNLTMVAHETYELLYCNEQFKRRQVQCEYLEASIAQMKSELEGADAAPTATSDLLSTSLLTKLFHERVSNRSSTRVAVAFCVGSQAVEASNDAADGVWKIAASGDPDTAMVHIVPWLLPEKLPAVQEQPAITGADPDDGADGGSQSGDEGDDEERLNLPDFTSPTHLKLAVLPSLSSWRSLVADWSSHAGRSKDSDVFHASMVYPKYLV